MQIFILAGPIPIVAPNFSDFKKYEQKSTFIIKDDK